jgi:hypothetical protein
VNAGFVAGEHTTLIVDTGANALAASTIHGQWLGSIRRIEALHPSVIVCGHGPVAIGDDLSRLVGTMRDILAQAIATGRSPTSGESL